MKNSQKTHKETAAFNYTTCMNCAQSVLKAFLPELGIDEKEASLLLKVMSGFGSGMGFSGQTCGSISGAIAVLGLKMGYDGPENIDNKPLLYKTISVLIAENRERYGTVICDGIKNSSETIPEISGKTELGQERCCVDTVEFNTERVCEIIGRE